MPIWHLKFGLWRATIARSPRLRSALRRGKSQPWAGGHNPFGIAEPPVFLYFRATLARFGISESIAREPHRKPMTTHPNHHSPPMNHVFVDFENVHEVDPAVTHGSLTGHSPDTRRCLAVDNFRTPGGASTIRRPSKEK
jgi:hypothetical protein